MTMARGEAGPITETAGGVLLHVHVLPRSSRCQLVAGPGDSLKVKLTAPPVEGRANEECIRFLADIFGVRREQVTVLGGHKSRHKTIAIKGLTKKDVEARLAACRSGG